MSGTLFGLSLSQTVDLNSLPSVGWKLYLYQASTSTPVNSYADPGLVTLNPWPLVADGYGRMQQFWLADGSYRARATNNDGSLTYFDIPSILAITPWPSIPIPPPPVDPTTVFQTGDVMWLDVQGTRTGWVRDNGRTIGSATSGASERANADTSALFQFLWNNFPNTICPVTAGRGGSAAADFAANKGIALPDKRGFVPGGLDDMGSFAAGRYVGVPITVGGVTTPGSLLGEVAHILSSAEMPIHTHTASVSDPQHIHPAVTAEQVFASAGGPTTTIAAGAVSSLAKIVTVTVSPSSTGIGVTNANAGSGGQHNNTQLTVLGTFYRKL